MTHYAAGSIDTDAITRALADQMDYAEFPGVRSITAGDASEDYLFILNDGTYVIVYAQGTELHDWEEVEPAD